MKKFTFLMSLGLLFILTSVHAQDVINPVSATTTLSPVFGSSLDNAINGTGLDDFPSLVATHEATSPVNSFLATNAVGSIDFDLGGTFSVEGLSFWNENGPGPGGTGIQGVIISASEDGINYAPISGAPTTFAQVMTPTSPAESFTFDAVNASFIRFEVTSNYGDPGNLVAFAEVAFVGTPLISGNIINPVSATTTLSPVFGSSLDNTINGTGLDDFPSLVATHEATSPFNSFLATNDAGTIDFDLGGTFAVEGLSFWNENGPGPGSTGIQGVIISASGDGINFTPITGAPTTFAQVMTPTSPAESFTFDAVNASFIRFEVTSNYGDPGNLVAFAEVAFVGTPLISGNIINPVSATTTLSPMFGSSLDNTINGTGLDDFPSLVATHEATSPFNSFLATNDAGTIDFDLGGTFAVEGLSFWNENGPGPGGTGIQGVIISASEDGINYAPISGAPTTFTQVMTPTSPAESFTFDTVKASFIRFEVTSNYGDPGNLVAFAEVAFIGDPVIVGLADNILGNLIELYPNPARDMIRISKSSDIDLERIHIYDINGRLVKELEISDHSTELTLHVSELNAGMYIVHISNDEASTIKKFIKE